LNNNSFSYYKNSIEFVKQPVLSLVILIIVGVVYRLYYFPYDIPITLDALRYFFYAIDVSTLWYLPSGYNFPNIGWSIFVSFFFSLFHSTNFLDYMMLQRMLTVTISALTAIPIYLLCSRFVEKKYAVVASSLFLFDPRIIENSVLGETQPLFILLIATTLFLFLSNNIKIIYLSFATVALLTEVRFEGVLLLIPISVLYFVRFRKDKKMLMKFSICICIYLAVISPIVIHKIQTTGQNGITDQVVGSAFTAGSLIQGEQNSNGMVFIVNGLINLFKYFGWLMIPTLLFFIPAGFILFLFKRDTRTWLIIFAALVMLLPSIYAYSRNIQEMRYLYALFPIFCVLSAYTLKKFSIRLGEKNIVIFLIVLGIILSSIAFLEYKKVDYKYESEAYHIAKKIDEITDSTNNFYPESKYVRVAELSNIIFPTPINGKTFGPLLISTDGYSSLEKYIEDNKYLKLQHIVIDGSEKRPIFLSDVYYNEDKYPYLIKVYDSADEGFEYRVKVFKIDYDRFLQGSGYQN